MRFLNSLFNLFWNLIRGLVWLSGWFVGVGLIIWYPMRWWPGDRFWPVQLLNYFMPWLLLGLIPATLAAGLAHRRWLTLTLTFPTLLIGLNLAPLFLPRTPPILAKATGLKVMSHNIWNHNRNLEAFIETVKQEQPDILLLQELDSYRAKLVRAALTDLFPYDDRHFAFEIGLRQGILSRYPLVPGEGSFNQGRAQKAVIVTPGGPVTVWNVHFSQPTLWERHYKQTQMLVEAIAQVEGPLIVGGDFNTTDQSQVYRLINKWLNNAHWEAGWGFGFSFPANRPKFRRLPLPTPLIRIDHLFYSDHFFAQSAQTLSTNGGSDHLPVVAELLLVQPQ